MKLKIIAQSLALIFMSGAAFADDTPPPDKMQKIEITGSAIKRSDVEGALPVQTITHQDIERAGITSTEQLLNTISANVGGVYNMSANQAEGFGNSNITHNSGASSANLRGLGPDSTLVLLNGRRVADHGLNGSAVDLNSIPLAAVERVEILKDGASAIYGADAIGGVINFILRTDYQGAEVSTSGDVTQHGGGDIYTGSILFGKGSLQNDGFNFMASLAVDKSTLLAGNQRSFQNGYQPDRGLAPDTRGTPYADVKFPNGFYLPGNPNQQLWANMIALQGGGPNACSSYPQMIPYPSALWGYTSRQDACAYDYGSDWALMQPVEHLNLVSRTSLKLDSKNTAYFELTGSHTKATDYYTPLQLGSNSNFYYPAGGPYYQNFSAYVPGFDPTQNETIRWRCLACGEREETTTTNTYRALAALEGEVNNWNYKAGLSAAGSFANTDLVNGYVTTSGINAAMDTGLINPWLPAGQQQTAAAMALINGAKITGPVYGGRSRLLEADGSVNGELMTLPAGPLSAAAGVDFRRESYDFDINAYAANNIEQSTGDSSLSQVSRNIAAVYGELAVPIVKGLDGDLAVRHDRYSDFGGTTNPKISLRYQPISSVLVRTSWNTGFHAPDFAQLYGGQTTNSLSNSVADPQCPKTVAAINCIDSWNFQSGGNPNLKPEKSEQWSAGLVFSPTSHASVDVDYWQIRRTDRIVQPDPTIMINYPQYVVRNPDGTINYIQDDLTNILADKTKGVDLGVKLNGKVMGEKLSFNLDGTYMISHASQSTPGQPMTEYVGQFGDPNNTYNDLYLRWRHTASLTWTHDVWSTTLYDQFNTGYKDEVPAGTVPPGFNPNVASYNLFNLGVGYTGIKDMTINFTIKNLFDTVPPFSAHNVDDVAGAGWDARVGQPRLRSFMLAVKYKFL
ncbi:MAG: TonB-dependent receptor [Burkholderiaceae bacterium]|nr:TonB-dependent receptor [Burkholderiaceae bacterium]